MLVAVGELRIVVVRHIGRGSTGSQADRRSDRRHVVQRNDAVLLIEGCPDM